MQYFARRSSQCTSRRQPDSKRALGQLVERLRRATLEWPPRGLVARLVAQDRAAALCRGRVVASSWGCHVVFAFALSVGPLVGCGVGVTAIVGPVAAGVLCVAGAGGWSGWWSLVPGMPVHLSAR